MRRPRSRKRPPTRATRPQRNRKCRSRRPIRLPGSSEPTVTAPEPVLAEPEPEPTAAAPEPAPPAADPPGAPSVWTFAVAEGPEVASDGSGRVVARLDAGGEGGPVSFEFVDAAGLPVAGAPFVIEGDLVILPDGAELDFEGGSPTFFVRAVGPGGRARRPT